MISIPSTYGFPATQPFPASGKDSSETDAGGGLRPAENTGQQPDTVTLSGQGRELSAQNSTDAKKTAVGASAVPQGTETPKDRAQQAQDLELIQQLKNRDAHVRAHEQAHLAVAGQYAAGSASFTYQAGPDGVKYAVGGEVPINISAESTPEATIQKMEVIKRAALAPADPSSADLQIASAASAKEMQAMQELQSIQREKANAHTPPADSEIVSSQKKGISTTSSSSPSNMPAVASIASSLLSPGNSRQMMIQTYQAMNSVA